MARISILSAAGLVLSAALGSLASARSPLGAPSLAHSAPLLGRTLTIDLTGAAASAPSALLYSPRAGSLALPFGTLELDPSSLLVLAQGPTDASGSASHPFAIPLDTALAENEVHLQAAVLDPLAAGGVALSNALHFRLQGPRLYVGFGSPGFGQPWKLAIASAVDENLLAGVVSLPPILPTGGFGGTGDRRPVFNANRSRGVVLDGGVLAFFDNSFGQLLATVPFANALPPLFTDPGGTRVYAMSDAAIHVFDFATGTETAQLPLSLAPKGWTQDAAQSEVYVAHVGGLRRVGLSPLADLGTTPLTVTPTNPLWAAGTVFVSGWGPFFSDGKVERVVYSAAGATVTTVPVPTPFPSSMLAVPAADQVLLRAFGGVFGFDYVYQMPLSLPGPVGPVPSSATSPTGMASWTDWHSDGTRVWFAVPDHGDSFGEPVDGNLFWFDYATQIWSAITPDWTETGPRLVEVCHDALVFKVYATVEPFTPEDSPFGADTQPGSVHVFDQTSGLTEAFPLGPPTPSGQPSTSVPFLLHAEPLP